jgi:hypothetical protein
VVAKNFLQENVKLVNQDPESMLYHSLFQKTALNQVRESIEILSLRKNLIKKRSNQVLDSSQINTAFDITNLA